VCIDADDIPRLRPSLPGFNILDRTKPRLSQPTSTTVLAQMKSSQRRQRMVSLTWAKMNKAGSYPTETRRLRRSHTRELAGLLEWGGLLTARSKLRVCSITLHGLRASCRIICMEVGFTSPTETMPSSYADKQIGITTLASSSLPASLHGLWRFLAVVSAGLSWLWQFAAPTTGLP
jgi:hypothetical protein